MKWQQCFEKYKYKSLISESNNENEKILMEMFFEEGEKPDELQQVYLSEKEDELFIILRMEPDIDAKQLSDKWDAKILAVINFGEGCGISHTWLEKMKYNITQIILYGEKLRNKNLEKSIDISRKIFLKCDKNDELEETEKVRLPFLYDEFETMEIKLNQREEIIELLPDKDEFPFLYEEHKKIDGRSVKTQDERLSYTDQELELVKGWIMSE
ncbi:MAG TPA: hypothetical protein DCS73_02285 [Roseburia sp.]|nr:hypothetical protein [Roseburia sp.]